MGNRYEPIADTGSRTCLPRRTALAPTEFLLARSHHPPGPSLSRAPWTTLFGPTHRPTLDLDGGQHEGLGIASIPGVDAGEDIIEEPRFRFDSIPIEEPPTRGGGASASPMDGGGGGAAGGSSCDVPMSMTKVTSGSFQGGLVMGDYYPDLVGRGFWTNGGTGGPWDTGSRAGANVQLFGTVPSPCRPEQYTLEQTVTREWEKIDGVATARSGTTSDDIAASGRDQSRAPFRQMWLGGGLNISMADPPSATYSATRDIDYKKHFVTSLRGPGGGRSVNWTIELKTSGGTVVTNSVS